MQQIMQALGLTDPQFWSNFWPNFWSTILAGTLIGAALSWILSKMRRASLEVTLEIASGLHGYYTLKFSVLNTGNVSFAHDEIYWHVYFPMNVKPENQDRLQLVALNAAPYYCFQGSLTLPCFRKASTMCIEIPVRVKDVAILDLTYFYSLSTTQGCFPRPTFKDRKKDIRDMALGSNAFVRMPLGTITKKSI